MLKKDFWYDLPKELIAQEPADPRDAARLMVLDRKNDKILHSVFHELPHYLEKGDLLVVNNSKVLPARLMGTKVPTGAVCELLLLRQVKGDTWEMCIRDRGCTCFLIAVRLQTPCAGLRGRRPRPAGESTAKCRGRWS